MISANNPGTIMPGKFNCALAADFFQIPYPIKENQGYKKIYGRCN
jgi:hypothetical protein